MLAWFNSPVTGTIIQLDATESLSDSRDASLSTSQVISGANITDNYYVGKRSFNVSGTVTGFKLRDNLLSPKDYSRAVDEVMDSQQYFSFFCTDDNTLRPAKNCLITNRSFSREGTNSDGLEVTLSIMEVDLVEEAETDVFVPTEEEGASSQLKSTDEGGDGGKTQATEVERKSIAKAFLDSGIGLFE